jgi:hypothetical protein
MSKVRDRGGRGRMKEGKGGEGRVEREGWRGKGGEGRVERSFLKK